MNHLRPAIVFLAILIGGMAFSQPKLPRGGGVRPHGSPLRGAEKELLEKILRGSRSARYSGVRYQEVFVEGDWRRGTEVVISDRDRHRTEFGADSSAPGQIVVDNGKKRLVFNPKANEIQVLPRNREDFLGRLRGLGEGPTGGGIEVVREPGTNIAGRRTDILAIKERKGNVLQKMWVDLDSGVILKREAFDLSGRRVALMEFSKINFNPKISDEDFKITRPGARIIMPEGLLKNLAAKEGFIANHLTDNEFELESVRVRKMGDVKVLIQLYGSMQGKVTLFQFKGDADRNRLSKFGGRMGQSYLWTDDGVSYVLLGNVPEERLIKLSRKLSVLK